MAAEAVIGVRSWWQWAAEGRSTPSLYDAPVLADIYVPAPEGAGNVVARASHLACGFDVSLAIDHRDAEGATQ
jgi:hypothetical protein